MTEETKGGYAATGSRDDLGALPTSGSAIDKSDPTGASDIPPGIATILERLDRLESRGRIEQRSAMAAHAYRREALEFALKASSPHGVNGRSAVDTAATFEAYLRDGVPAKPAQPALPTNFTKMANLSSPELLDALTVIMAERLRQIEDGYDAAHDDAHSDGEILYQAVMALAPDGVLLESDRVFGSQWVNRDQSPRKRLLQGVALAVAEMERNQREAGREAAAMFATTLEPIKPEAGTSVTTSVTTTDRVPAPAGMVDAIEAGEVRTRAPDTPTDAPAHGLSSDDFARMANALGAPTHPLNQTYRNRYVVNAGGDVATRLDALPDIWASEPFLGGSDGARLYWVKPAGREALADYMKRFPGVIRDTKDNSKERPYIASSAPDDEPDYEAPRDPEPSTDEAAMEATAVPAKDGDQPKAKRTRKRRK